MHARAGRPVLVSWTGQGLCFAVSSRRLYPAVPTSPAGGLVGLESLGGSVSPALLVFLSTVAIVVRWELRLRCAAVPRRLMVMVIDSFISKNRTTTERDLSTGTNN
jgi:hypothetical protein